MRIVHIAYYYGTSNTCGACIAATRLHRALLDHGIDSHYLCCCQREHGDNIHIIPAGKLCRAYFWTINRITWIATRLFFGKIYMPNFFHLPGLTKAIKEIEPDIIQIHFIYQDMLSLSQLEKLHQPLIITLHDILSVNPTDPYPGSDRRYINGVNRHNSTLVERWIFSRKKQLVSAKKPLFIGPSDWICKTAKESLIGKCCETVMVPNIADLRYHLDSTARAHHDKFTILFGASGGRRSPLKGWHDLESALLLLPAEIKQKIRVNIFGESAEPYKLGGIEVRFLGNITSTDEMCRIHNESDIFALPSKEDNAPQTKFEALLCGSPVVAFRRTGCAEWIVPGVNGWIADNGSHSQYAQGLLHFYELYKTGKLSKTHEQIASDSANRFCDESVISKLIPLYSGIIRETLH